jgi:glucose-6-phosphate 1-dehydrogenase
VTTKPASRVFARSMDMPIIGVAKSGWNLDQLKDRARDSIKEHGRFDADAFAQLAARLQYIDGDYNDQATYERLRQRLANAQRPLHYLAIPPSMFGRLQKIWPNPDAQNKLALLSKNPLAVTSLRRRR